MPHLPDLPRGLDRGRIAIGLVALGLLAAALLGGWAWRAGAANRDAAAAADRRSAVTRTTTRTLGARRVSTLRTIAALDAELRTRTAERDALFVSLAARHGQLREAQETLGREAAGLQALEARVGALRTCLGGVEGALNSLAIGDTATALRRLRTVGDSCDTAA
jgi:hypothetical protein